MKKLIKRLDYFLGRHIWGFIDGILDRRVCGISLAKYVPSIDRNDQAGLGGTGSDATHYVFLKRIFSHLNLKDTDVLLDVGCGKGRVLAFLILSKAKCRLHGIEHNESVGRMAINWSEKYEQIHISVGDAFQLDYNEYTVLSLARSFLPKTLLAFTEQLERTLTHPITLVYWYDGGSGYPLQNRPGWELQFRETVDRIYGIRLFSCPQSYSIWKYNPQK